MSCLIFQLAGDHYHAYHVSGANLRTHSNVHLGVACGKQFYDTSMRGSYPSYSSRYRYVAQAPTTINIPLNHGYGRAISFTFHRSIYVPIASRYIHFQIANSSINPCLHTLAHPSHLHLPIHTSIHLSIYPQTSPSILPPTYPSTQPDTVCSTSHQCFSFLAFEESTSRATYSQRPQKERLRHSDPGVYSDVRETPIMKYQMLTPNCFIFLS